MRGNDNGNHQRIVRRGLRGRAAFQADEMLKFALYDAELARDFANAVRAGAVAPPRAKRLQARLFALGLPYQREDR